MVGLGYSILRHFFAVLALRALEGIVQEFRCLLINETLLIYANLAF